MNNAVATADETHSAVKLRGSLHSYIRAVWLGMSDEPAFEEKYPHFLHLPSGIQHHLP